MEFQSRYGTYVGIVLCCKGIFAVKNYASKDVLTSRNKKEAQNLLPYNKNCAEWTN